jgi:hypothetical protein
MSLNRFQQFGECNKKIKLNTYTDYKAALHKNEIVNTRFVEIEIFTICKKTLLMTLDICVCVENDVFLWLLTPNTYFIQVEIILHGI